jgi:hypothetical protein
MLKLTHSKGSLNLGLTGGAIVGSLIPIIATVATGGLAAVGLPLWIALGGAVSGLLAGNVELKSSVDRSLDADAAKTDQQND